MPLIKNKKGTIVSVDEKRKAYLLNDKPVLLRPDGKPKVDANGNTVPLVKSADEIGWTDVSKAEEAAYYEKLEADQEAANEVSQAAEAAALTAVAATMAANNAQKKAHNAAKGAKPGRKSNAQKEQEAAAQKAAEEMEMRVRDAEGDPAKYEALSEDEKEMYVTLFGAVPGK